MYRFPKKLQSIADPVKFREYCLRPLGLKVDHAPLAPQPRKVDQFVNFGMKLQRTDKPLEKDVIALRIYNTKENITKPEIKQYLEKIYGLDVQKVHTLNYMGQVVKNHKGQYRNRLKDFKKTYVKLNEEVDTNFQKFEKI